MKNYLKYICLVFFCFSCNNRDEHTTTEDYKKLFPFTGIDKPITNYEDMIPQPCDPREALENYKYPGAELPESREYEVTLKCTFKEPVSNEISSKYVIRYIDENKNLVLIGSDKYDSRLKFRLKNSVEKVIKFKVKSGYPMYLSVNGQSPREASIKASISAISTDKHLEVPELSVEETQNREGPNDMISPFCNYIILP